MSEGVGGHGRHVGEGRGSKRGCGMVYMAGTTGLAGALLDLASLRDTRWPQIIETHIQREEGKRERVCVCVC